MEGAWRGHVGKLTLEQLQSPDACRAHLQSFPRSVVSQVRCLAHALEPVNNCGTPLN